MATCNPNPTTWPYRPRDPADSVLAQLVTGHLDAFLAALREHHPDSSFLPIIERELAAIGTCGDLCRGFVRLQCVHCRAPRVVPLSCKSRLCSSCAGRRMAEQSAYWVDRVLPRVPWRQWTLSFPWDLRRALAFDAKLARTILHLVTDSIGQWQRSRAAGKVAAPSSGALVQIQRFGDGATLNFHLHMMIPEAVADAAAEPSAPAGRPVPFVHLPPPTPSQLQALLEQIALRIHRWLHNHRGATEMQQNEDGQQTLRLDLSPLGQPLPEPRLSTGQPAPGRGRHVPGSNKRRLPRGEVLATTESGYSLHLTGRIAAPDRKRLERVCKYLSRPPIAEERLRWLPDGNIAVTLKRAWRGNITELKFKPHAFLARMANLLPPPGFHMVRFYGFLAPSSPLRPRILPKPPDPAKTKQATAPERPARMKWCDLLWRSLRVDGLRCPDCDGRMRIIATILKPDAVEAIAAAIIASGHLHPARLRSPRPPPATRCGPSIVPLPDIA
jgi:hypothetical protein